MTGLRDLIARVSGALGPAGEMLLGAGALAAGITVLVAGLLSVRRDRKYRVERRLARIVAAHAAVTETATGPATTILRDSSPDDRSVGPGRFWKRLRRRLRLLTAGARGRLVAATGAAVIAAGWGAAGLVGPLVGLIAAPVAGLGVFALYLDRLERRRLDSFQEQLPDALQMITRGLRSGLPLPEAMSIVAQEGSSPVAEVFQRIRDQIAIGVAPQTALAEAVTTVPLTEFRFFAVSVAIQYETGGRLADTLENLAAIVQRRRETREKVTALTAEGRTSARIVATLPAVGALGMSLLNPGYLGRLLESDGGSIALALALVAMAAGFLVINRMTAFQ